jgi:beta-lactam-binding protein with PASTA domain
MTVKEFFGKFKAPMFWGNLLAMLVVVILLCFGLKWWLSSYTHHGEGIEVPNLYGITHRVAVHRLDSIGLVVVANDSSYVEGLPAGAIIQQNPAPGMKVKSGRIIYVTINSLTMPCERIPDLIDNCSYREAEARLKSLGFELLSPKLIDGEKDWVYGIQYHGRNLVSGESVPRESELTLVIGNGSLGEEKDSEGSDNGDSDAFSSDEIDDFLEVLE